MGPVRKMLEVSLLYSKARPSKWLKDCRHGVNSNLSINQLINQSINQFRIRRSIDCIFFRLVGEYFTYVKRRYHRRWRAAKFKPVLFVKSREGSLSCHICYDTGPQFSQSHLKESSVCTPFKTIHGVLKSYITVAW